LLFKGNWSSPFEKTGTFDQDFYTTASAKKTTKMMHKTFKIPYHHDEELKVSVGSLKYNLTGANNGEVMEMVIVLPDEKDGLVKLEVRVV
jgi:serine protease inhibitor